MVCMLKIIIRGLRDQDDKIFTIKTNKEEKIIEEDLENGRCKCRND